MLKKTTGYLVKGAGAALALGVASAAIADGHTHAKGYVAPTPIVDQQHYNSGKYGRGSYRANAHRAAAMWTVPGCPPGFNGMFRGNLYCINGKPIK